LAVEDPEKRALSSAFFIDRIPMICRDFSRKLWRGRKRIANAAVVACRVVTARIWRSSVLVTLHHNFAR
jgi:hypothetical protein